MFPQSDGGQELPKSCSFFRKIARGFTNSPANSSRFSPRVHDNRGVQMGDMIRVRLWFRRVGELCVVEARFQYQ